MPLSQYHPATRRSPACRPSTERGCGARPAGQRRWLFDIKKIVLRCHFTERDNFDAVGFPLWGIEKQIFKVVAAFRLHHVFAEHFDIVAILHGISDVHDVSGMSAVFVILAAEQCG